MNKIQQEDINSFVESFELSDSLNDSSFLITGATGLIGSTLVCCLLALKKGIKITCPVRNLDKAKEKFNNVEGEITFIETDLITYLNNLSSDDTFQYIVHCASPTAGNYMMENPVETFELAFESTKLLINYSRKNPVKGMVYVSSLEYYGQNEEDNLISEDFQGYVDTSSPRSSYPLGKRAAEYLCTANSIEYGVPVKIARLTQTFGAGVSIEDNRVFAQFARSVIAGKDIVLHTTGASSKPYCYTIDSISAVLYILLRGENGEAYNVANENTYISIKDLAEFLREKFNPSIKVIVESHPEMGYAPYTKLHLNTAKLIALGWKPTYSLEEMFRRLIMHYKMI